MRSASSGFALWTVGLAACLAIAVLAGQSYAAGPQGGLTGPAFTDPDKQISMPSDWVSGKVVHEDWAKDADIAVTLDQQLYPALLAVIQNFAAERNVRIAVGEGTCGISAGHLIRKSVEVAGFCCPPGDADRLPGLRFHTLGIASVGILVNRENPVENLTSEQARRLFMGDYLLWSDLGAVRDGVSALPVRVIARLHCKTRPGHWRLMLDNEDLFSLRLQEVSTIPDMISSVAAYPGAAGFETLWNIGRFGATGKVKAVRVDGFDPSDDRALVSGNYPFYRTYSITTWEGEGLDNPLARELVQYLMERVRTLDPKYGIVPVHLLRDAGWKFTGDELVGGPD